MDDPEIGAAKRAAAGPLGKELAKYPLLFAKAVFFGRRPSRSHPTLVRNGTITLADLGEGPIGITCHHVIEQYRNLRSQHDDILFQIGHIVMDPLPQLIAQSARLDVAVIRLTDLQVRAITSEGKIGSCLYLPKQWPPPEAKEGQFLSFGGFPGKLREAVDFDDLVFNSWSSGATEISSVSEHRLVSAFDRSCWVGAFGARDKLDLTELGGLSGGPAFINRGLYWDLVGIVSDYHENYDAMFFAATSPIQPDGSISEPPQ